jgi:predicted DNA-binding ribbon-helix-helix protein
MMTSHLGGMAPAISDRANSLLMRTARMNRVPRRTITIAGRRTSSSLEDAFWIALKEIARGRDMPLSQVIAAIDSERYLNLSSAIRVFVLDFYRDPDRHLNTQEDRMITSRNLKIAL